MHDFGFWLLSIYEMLFAEFACTSLNATSIYFYRNFMVPLPLYTVPPRSSKTSTSQQKPT